MAPSLEPVAELSPLPKADGSASFSYGGYSVTAAVAGPIEAPRREEQAFEAFVDVVVRPAAGTGGTAERQLESVLQASLRQLIPIRNFPRCMIQLTLQTMETPNHAYAHPKLARAQVNLSLLPALLHASILALLTAAVPLKTIATATTLAVTSQDGKMNIVVDPVGPDLDRAQSIHVLGFTSDGELLLAHSEGIFSTEEWDQVLEMGQSVCCQTERSNPAVATSAVERESPSVKAFLRHVMEAKSAADLHWK